MNKRIWGMLLIVVALLAVLPHLPTWYPAARDAVSAFRVAALLPPLLLALQMTRSWVTTHQPVVEIAGGAALLVGALTVAVVLTARGRRRRRRTADAAVLIMPDRPIRRPGTTLADRTTLPAAEPAVAATVEPRRPPRPSGVMQPFERESRRAMVSELFRNGRSISEIARITGIGQDAIRAAVREPRSA
ncbi:MAG TPA: hypothetical protein VGM77_10000 [Gemmatimonadales bacterium]|jgi:hypothetical protein